jgi:hypothetical protein
LRAKKSNNTTSLSLPGAGRPGAVFFGARLESGRAPASGALKGRGRPKTHMQSIDERHFKIRAGEVGYNEAKMSLKSPRVLASQICCKRLNIYFIYFKSFAFPSFLPYIHY